MLRKKTFAISAILIMLSLSLVSIVESEAVDQALSTSLNEKFSNLKSKSSFPQINFLIVELKNRLNKFDYNNFLSTNQKEFASQLNNFLLSNLIGNFSSSDVIFALIGSILFLLITQPIFLQLIVETGNQFLFIVILISLLLIESFQKIFALRIVGFWDPYVKNDVDGFWNFFSIVFFSSYFKIYLSYLPTFIIQYSNVFTKAFFYILMFTIPILFNVCIADSIDMIDWNRDEISLLV